jgi:hypothetical protein
MGAWIDEVEAVLLIWLGGMEWAAPPPLCWPGREPSGKLTLTLPSATATRHKAINFPGDETQVVFARTSMSAMYYDIKQLERSSPSATACVHPLRVEHPAPERTHLDLTRQRPCPSW